MMGFSHHTIKQTSQQGKMNQRKQRTGGFATFFSSQERLEQALAQTGAVCHGYGQFLGEQTFDNFHCTHLEIIMDYSRLGQVSKLEGFLLGEGYTLGVVQDAENPAYLYINGTKIGAVEIVLTQLSYLELIFAASRPAKMQKESQEGGYSCAFRTDDNMEEVIYVAGQAFDGEFHSFSKRVDEAVREAQMFW